MVGVPGRSKGCNTCRKRKIACSLERPQCVKCIKSNRVCTGYERERIFVFHNDTASANSSPDSDASSKSSQKSLVKPKGPKTKELCRPKQLCLAESVPPVFAYRQQIVSEFLSRYVPNQHTSGQSRQGQGWLSLVPGLPEPTMALESSVLAVCTAKVSQWNADPVLAEQSQKLYGRALRELQYALWDPDLMHKDETLAAAMALMFYEAIECPENSADAWASHLKGCEGLIRARGPIAHSTPLAHKIFLAYRTDEIQVAIRSHRHTFLSDPEWIEGPWKGQVKSPLDNVLDIAASLSRIFVEAIEETENKDRRVIISVLLRIVNRCWETDLKLRNFFDQYESENGGVLFWQKPSADLGLGDDEPEGKLFPMAFHFESLRVAHTCMIYWATYILLAVILSHVYGIILSLQLDGAALDQDQFIGTEMSKTFAIESTDADYKVDGEQISFQKLELTPLEDRHDVVHLSRNICQSVEYCMQTDMREIGQVLTVVPLMAVLDVLNEHPGGTREKKWAQAHIRRLNSKVKIVRHAVPQE